MIGVQAAQQLKQAGLTWKPGPGDHFVIPDRDLDEDVFVLSNMTIEVYNVPEGRVIGRGLVNYTSAELPGMLGRSTRDLAKELGPEYEREVVHRDDLVIL